MEAQVFGGQTFREIAEATGESIDTLTARKRVGYWQAWGLLALSTILFKGMGSNHGGDHNDRKRRRHLRQYMEEPQGSGDEAAGKDLD